jgi:phosphoribosyl 1,2-cyclic phosphodiesterase
MVLNEAALCAGAQRSRRGGDSGFAMLWRTPRPDEALQVRFWGVRGSVAASGPRFVMFGGHTPCVEVRCGGRLFVVDAGTGLSALGAALGEAAPDEVDILLSHLHLDHVGGLPFFKPATLGERVIRTWCGNLGGRSAETPLDRLYAPPLFPVRLDQLPARFEHHGFKAGETLRFESGRTIATHPLNHPGGATGYRFDHLGRRVCYISDIEHTHPWPPPDLARFVENADLMIYDGMFTEAEYPACRGWGHSTWEKGAELARRAGVQALAIIHHHPQHDDDRLRGLEIAMQAVMPSAFLAREGQALALAPVA